MIRLTYVEWLTIQEQCSACRRWNNIKGCDYPEGSDRRPVHKCSAFERNEPAREAE